MWSKELLYRTHIHIEGLTFILRYHGSLERRRDGLSRCKDDDDDDVEKERREEREIRKKKGGRVSRRIDINGGLFRGRSINTILVYNDRRAGRKGRKRGRVEGEDPAW